ncbi:6-phosphogluconate phosphatase [Photobacterium sagamiensis]|uniref:6-phosphogluconate phosphatase n=1 Tax=Photobacterium sagamiensis TaxID=2910241 RepID=UPI003D0D4A52
MDRENNIRCIIFDCDGTLVDSEKLCNQALVNIFARFGVTLSLDDCLRHFQGGKLADILADTCERVGLLISIDILDPLYRQECARLFEQGLNPVQGVPELLEALVANDYEMCIASNAPVSKIEHALRLTSLLPYFEGKLFSAFEANSWKPEPDILHFAAMNMGVSLKQCAFVDDTVKGVQAGINAEIRTFHFLTTPESVRVDHPNVTTLTEMPQLLEYI